jgi:hypothetical protein
MAGPIFVVGAPRTGTTLTRNILNRHPEVHLYNEIHFCERIHDKLGQRGELDETRLDGALDMLLEHAQEWTPGAEEAASRRELRQRAVAAGGFGGLLRSFLAMEAEWNGKRIWGDSSPQDVLYLDCLKSWFPAARIVCLVRDPRAYLASYKNYVRKGHPTYHDRYSPLPNALLWRTYMGALLEARQAPWAADLHELRYERLVADPQEEVRALCAFLDLEFQGDMLEVASRNSSYLTVGEEGRAGISSGSVDRWREELTATEIWIAEWICRRAMRHLGYHPEGRFPGPAAVPALLQLAALLPRRLYNLLFRTRKPFTWAKMRRVISNLGS